MTVNYTIRAYKNQVLLPTVSGLGFQQEVSMHMIYSNINLKISKWWSRRWEWAKKAGSQTKEINNQIGSLLGAGS